MSDRFEAWLESSGLVKPADVESAEEAAEESGELLGEVLIRRGFLDEREAYRRLAGHCGIAFAEFEALLDSIDPQVVRSVPRPYQDRKRVIPVLRRQGVLVVVTCDPDARVLDLADALACESVELKLVTPTDFRRVQWALDLGQLGTGRPVRPQVAYGSDLLDHDVRVEPAHVGLLDAILADAAGERASDVHLERFRDRVQVRLRVDGALREVSHYQIQSHQLQGIVNVLKVRARLDIAERRRPQGGRMAARIGGRDFDLRVQTQPTLHGEYAIVRLLPQGRDLFSIETLGFSPGLAARCRRLLRSPSGLVLVAGPTGSGKSTTLYAGLQVLAADTTRKIISVEDPIEYSVDGVEQTQVRPELGFGFADAMRHFVRQDPDVIMVGEIRDPETALEALRAAQTGHLVLSTVHANDSVDAVQRLYDLGMHPNSIAGELLAVFAQRLARRICEGCRAECEPDAELLSEVFPRGAPEGFRTFRGEGCERCRGLGHFGRTAVGELLPSSRELRLAVSRHAALDELRAVAQGAGLQPMRESALELVNAGVIAFEVLPGLFRADMLAG
ncbi:MAG: type II/IV secretion system protein [Deltaproteobacteria bacterium]|nr:type II/IV secretion system protein [Deltaproteobacteria bacterium]MBW2413359.1 type II/IV secretion system protein [Deltaproteobacteria bacterium]